MTEEPESKQLDQEVVDAIAQELEKPKIGKLFKLAEKYGVVFKGYSGVDYLRKAIDSMGWECTIIAGGKGSAKSNLLLQRGYAIYKDWDQVLDYTAVELGDFARILDFQEGRIPWMGYDDIAVHLPKNLYFTDRDLWAELQQNWEALRTSLNCFDCTVTRKNKIIDFILGDMTGDIICYDREKDIKSHYDYRRWMWLRHKNDPRKMFCKSIMVEDIPFPLVPDMWKIDKELQKKHIVGGEVYEGERFYEQHGLTGVPREVFAKYWDRRLALAHTAQQRFKALLTKRADSLNKKEVSSEEKSSAGKQLARLRWKK